MVINKLLLKRESKKGLRIMSESFSTDERMFNGVPKRHYEPLKIDFEIPPILQEYIDNFIDDLNNHVNANGSFVKYLPEDE